jgi:endonuclease/exonuclease/phosphatase family metal-dependent hydrolase
MHLQQGKGALHKRGWALVCLAALTCAPYQLHAEPGSPERIVVAAYNLENYLRMERRVDGKTIEDAPKPEASTAAAIEVIRSVNPDILGVVEMGDPEIFADFRERLKAAGLAYPHAEHLMAFDTTRSVALLSRFPIVARDSRAQVTFELGGHLQHMNRGILDATVEVRPDYRLRLVGAHLKSRREVPDYDQAEFRAKEAWHLRRHLASILEKAPSTRLVLFGDLNDTKNEYPIREIIGTRGTPDHMMDIWLKDSRGELWTHYWKAADIYSRIDYIMVSPALTKEVDFDASGISDLPIWSEASDHRLIHATLRIPTP